MSFAGNLATVTFADILQLLSTGKKSGALVITRGSQSKEIFFRNGHVIYATSTNADEDLLGQLLVKRGTIKQADLDRALALQKTSGKKLGATLIELQLISQQEMAACLKIQIEEIVYSLFGWNQGEFNFHEGRTPSANTLVTELNTMNIVMEGMRRIDEWGQIQKNLPPDNIPLKVTLPPPVKGEVPLSADEISLLTLVNGQRTLSDLIRESPVGEFATTKAVHRLVSAGLLEKSNAPRLQVSEEKNEEHLWTLMLKVYASAFAVVARTLQQKLGEAGQHLYRDIPEKTARGVDGQLVQFVFGEGFDHKALFAALAGVPREVRLFSLCNRFNRLLADALAVVQSALGSAVKKQVVAEIKRDIGLVLGESRSLAVAFQLEGELTSTLRQLASRDGYRG